MSTLNIGVVGYGYVGRAIARYFMPTHRIHVYDKYLPSYSGEDQRAKINCCDIVFLAVPTPTASDGWHCDLRELYDALSWIRNPCCIKSTIPPGTVSSLSRLYACRVAYSPEYIGEGPGHPWRELDSCGFVILGGDRYVVNTVKNAYIAITPTLAFAVTDVTTAELCKYMENAFLAAKVAFVNQFFDIAKTLDVDFQELVSLWTLDPRVGKSHCAVTRERGFGGKCLPKDLKALIAAMGDRASTTLLQSILSYNDAVRRAALPAAVEALQ